MRGWLPLFIQPESSRFANSSSTWDLFVRGSSTAEGRCSFLMGGLCGFLAGGSQGSARQSFPLLAPSGYLLQPVSARLATSYLSARECEVDNLIFNLDWLVRNSSVAAGRRFSWSGSTLIAPSGYSLQPVSARLAPSFPSARECEVGYLFVHLGFFW